MNGILVHYGELALKGNNRKVFEGILRNNIEKKAGGKATSHEGRIFCINSDIEKLGNVFGISWYSRCIKIKKNIDEIIETVIQNLNNVPHRINTFGVYVKRSDKSFKLNSVEIAAIVGKKIKDSFELNVNLDDPDLPVYIEIADSAYIHFEKKRGLGGLPMGVSGRLLSLLSGGIDSPVASFQMMRRGCEMDFIHFHALRDGYDHKSSKIGTFVRLLNHYQHKATLYLVPYNIFQKALLQTKIIQSYELVMFRRFMIKLSEKMAIENGYPGLVLGDNLGQVASQTLENLYAARFDCRVPVYQPLISVDKEDIINKSRELGTYELSLQPYKDCCSLVSKNPKTKAKLDTVIHYTDKLNLKELVDKTYESVEKIVI